MHPLLQRTQTDPHTTIHLISFERNLANAKINLHPDISVIYFKLYPFFGTCSLKNSIRQLHHYLQKLPNYAITARGPLSGYIALHAAIITNCKQLTIQARGLLGQEYGYAHKNDNYLMRPLHWFRKLLFNRLEREVYCLKERYCFIVTIEAVSPALKEYLVKQYGADQERIAIASHDIPLTIELARRSIWRQEIRVALNIPTDAYVYAYNGSAKPWQCPELIISFFEKKYHDNENSLLLILTHDGETFKQLLKKTKIQEKSYRILSVDHQEIYRYLAAADAGLLFRQPHIINWVSRPTKALEYHAVGLPVIHNSTVEYLK